jgi:hypothetical protein
LPALRACLSCGRRRRLTAVLKGSDVDWQSCRVVAGHAIGLILNYEELLWLRKVWAEATSN